MGTSTVRLYSLTASQPRTWFAAAAFIAGNIVVSQLCRLIPDGGRILLLIYLFTLLGAYKYGWRVGLLTALLSPLLDAALFGMPAAAALPATMFRSVAAALAASCAALHTGRITLRTMAAVVAGYQVAGALFEWCWSGSPAAAVGDLRTGAAGMVLQAVGVWAAIRYIFRN